MLSKHFVRSTDPDDVYSFGPKVALKFLNLNETITLTITEFITPTIFFASEYSNDCTLDRHINILYDSLSDPMKFSTLPQIGTTCVSRYSVDNFWYRARVVDRNVKNMTVDLLFIDYGNIERSVHFTSIRKLEGTLSTQFSSFMDCSKLNSQGALFGFLGAVAGETDIPWKDQVKQIEMKRCFEFQVMNIPPNKSNTKNLSNTNIPFYLIKKNVFSKDISTNYENYLLDTLKWKKSDLEESLNFLVRSFKNKSQHFKNIHILLPNLLKDFNDEFNPKPESLHSLDDNENGIACVTPQYSENELTDDESHEGSVSSINRDYKKCDDDVLVNVSNLNDNDESKVSEVNDEQTVSCSASQWKMTSLLVKSMTHNLQWHIPLPEEHSFKALITSFNEKLEFNINICSEDCSNAFKAMEILLLNHFILCNDSMLKHYVSADLQFSNGTVCLCSFKSTYFRCVIVNITSSGDVTCRLIDFGDEIVLPKSDFIPISDQFCQIPPLAIHCILPGFDLSNVTNLDMLTNKFHKTIEQVDYEVLLSVCLSDKLACFSRMDDKVIVEQPLPVEVFIVTSPSESITSVNAMLLEMRELKIEEATKIEENTETEFDSNKPLVDYYDDEDDEITNGMKDIFINENLHQQTNMRFQDNKKRVCEYYRAKGRCFKGSKCQDRHVMDSDESDNDSEDWKMMDHMHYLNESFERELIIGSFIGIRVSAIYTAGIFYAYLTHDINGFIDDGQTYFEDSDSDDETNDGLKFQSIREMEVHLREFLKFQQVSIDKRFDLPVNTMVAVCEDDMVHRGSVRRMISASRCQVFLVDYGIPVEVNMATLSLLPRQYMSRFRQQCFQCKLYGVTVSGDQSRQFADWFYDRVNKRVLHCRVVDTDQERTNYVELYNFNETEHSDINSAAKRLL